MPKEKAKELIASFAPHVGACSVQMKHNQAKECALICVDQILRSSIINVEYWQNVRQEIITNN